MFSSCAKLCFVHKGKLESNSEKLSNWVGDDPCGHGWVFIICSGCKVSHLRFGNAGLQGKLPSNLNSLSRLQHLVLDGNNFSGPLPTLNGLLHLETAYLGNQRFTSIPHDFFNGLASLIFISLEYNPLNVSTGWALPNDVSSLSSLRTLILTGTHLTGPIPSFLGLMPYLKELRLAYNQLTGRIPASFDGAGFVRLEVNNQLVNPPLSGPIDVVGNMPSLKVLWLHQNAFSGTIPLSLGHAFAIEEVMLNNNRLTGIIPMSLSKLRYLVLLDVSNNDLHGLVPAFNTTQVQVSTSGNPAINILEVAPYSYTAYVARKDPSDLQGLKQQGTPNLLPDDGRKLLPFGIVAATALGIIALLFTIGGVAFVKYLLSSSWERVPIAEDVGEEEDHVRVEVHGQGDEPCGNDHGQALHSSGAVWSTSQVEGLQMSIEMLKSATGNFSQGNILRQGRFGMVYKGKFNDSTLIAVKRLQADDGAHSKLGLGTFQAELSVLMKVRHINLVALLGFCIEGMERYLVYEYQPLGTLAEHLFDWKDLGLSPLSWEKRLTIALDVARGLEYLHGLPRHSFIHGDLKPANIFLGDDFRAKVSEFGLMKLMPEGEVSMQTKLAGTSGYLAPEYAATGHVSRKADVYTYGVVLMELITGRKPLDHTQEDDIKTHLITMFETMMTEEEEFKSKCIDSAMVVGEEGLQNIWVVAQLAGHCTLQDPLSRPDMSHVVNMIAPLVERWKLIDENTEKEDTDVDIKEALKKWQAVETSSISSENLEAAKSLASKSKTIYVKSRFVNTAGNSKLEAFTDAPTSPEDDGSTGGQTGSNPTPPSVNPKSHLSPELDETHEAAQTSSGQPVIDSKDMG